MAPEAVDEASPLKSSKKKSKKRQREKRLEEAEEPRQIPEAAEIIQATTQLVPDRPNAIPPIVGYFPSGYNPCKDLPQEEGSDSNNNAPKVKVYRNKSERKANRLQVVVSPSKSSVHFVGSNYYGEAAAPQVCRYSLGILDKETQTLKIVPIASNKIFRMEPVVRRSDSADQDASNSVMTPISAAEKASRIRELTSLYGSKRQINVDKKMQALRKEDDPHSQKLLEEKLNVVNIDKEALESTSALISHNIPPYDSSATIPEKAYPLDKIILNGEWKFLEDIYKLLDAEEYFESSAYPTFVSRRMRKLQGIQNEVEKKNLSCIFSYITHLVKFKDQFSMDRHSSAKDHKIPSILRRKFETMFADPQSRRLSPEKIDLLTSYVLVLTLHADGFKTDPSDIAKDLRTSSVDLRRYFENLGCKMRREQKMLVATLPVPLTFPTKEKRKRRRR